VFLFARVQCCGLHVFDAAALPACAVVCPEGCTELEASRVRVEKNGASLTVDPLGSFSTGEACPDWLAALDGVCERYAAP
jgi:hypothetical protein